MRTAISKQTAQSKRFGKVARFAVHTHTHPYTRAHIHHSTLFPPRKKLESCCYNLFLLILHKVTLLTVHPLSVWNVLLFHLKVIFTVLKAFFSLFCWSSITQFMTIFVSRGNCLKDCVPLQCKITNK